MDIDSIARLITLATAILIVGSQIRAYFDGSNKNKTINETDKIFIARLDVQEKSLERLDKELARKDTENIRLHDDLDKLDTKFNSLRIEFDLERGKFNGQIGDLEDDRDKLSETNRMNGERIAVLDSQRNDLQTRLNELQSAYTELQHKYEELLAIVKNKDGEVANLTVENKTYIEFLVYIGLTNDTIDQIKNRKFEVFNEWKNNLAAARTVAQESEVPSSLDSVNRDAVGAARPIANL